MADINVYYVLVSAVCFLLITLAFLRILTLSKKKRRAPGPWGFPIVGHLPLFGSQPTATFRKWRKLYGDVFRIRLGSWNAVVLNGYSTIKMAMERRSDAFSGRPDFFSTQLTRKFRDDEDSVEFGPFNVAYLKQQKLTAYALRKFTNIRNSYVDDLVDDEVEKLATLFVSFKEEPADIIEPITLSVGCVIYQLLFGKGGNVREDESFKLFVRNTEDFNEFVGSSNAMDVLPWLRFILRDKVHKFLGMARISDEILQRKLKEHKESLDANNLRDVTDVFLAANLPDKVDDKAEDITEARLLHTVSDLLGAGYSTVSTSMHWLFLYMLAYPDVQRQVQSEIDNVVENGRKVDLNDRPKLHYTQATILEVMRMISATPLALPHSTTIDTHLNGYDIDKNTVVIVNLHSINFDESLWENPDSFKPERHLDAHNTFKKHSPVSPFGLGRRRCVGESFAKNEVFLFFTRIIQRFSFQKPEHDCIDLKPIERLTNTPKPFRAIIKERKINFDWYDVDKE